MTRIEKRKMISKIDRMRKNPPRGKKRLSLKTRMAMKVIIAADCYLDRFGR